MARVFPARYSADTEHETHLVQAAADEAIYEGPPAPRP